MSSFGFRQTLIGTNAKYGISRLCRKGALEWLYTIQYEHQCNLRESCFSTYIRPNHSSGSRCLPLLHTDTRCYRSHTMQVAAICPSERCLARPSATCLGVWKFAAVLDGFRLFITLSFFVNSSLGPGPSLFVLQKSMVLNLFIVICIRLLPPHEI